MLDWAPVVVGVVLFVILSPGLLFELPGLRRWVDFGSLRVTGKAATVHTLLFFVLYTIIIVVCDVHIYSGA
ncbi:hypothetical protein PR202_ga20558 [Eleusine coracana subsp. coracana]|uniref:Uncharacterized protein n=1 Tax=Eleusine coracana subsp. coracana TaxID=191504 RepID=A0AAV5CWY2_ELECO|nr:hypothetical protein QOZ80_4AG0320330 [Eleusine coracana subsp. coracana]GJN03148.1 hypothetical protein PR202_ga20558 [Eleusine coracana subsp. coracana]